MGENAAKYISKFFEKEVEQIIQHINMYKMYKNLKFIFFLFLPMFMEFSPDLDNSTSHLKTIILGAGCFWSVEKKFQEHMGL